MPGGHQKQLLVSTIVDNIDRQVACALYAPSGDLRIQKALKDFLSSQPVAAVQLTLQVTESEGLDPNISFIAPYWQTTIKGSNISPQGAWSLGVALNGIQERQLVLNYVLDLDNPKLKALAPAASDAKICLEQATSDTPNGQQLEGDLGLTETIGLEVDGLEHTAPYHLPPLPPPMPPAPPGAAAPAAAPTGAAEISPAKASSTSFSAQAQFTVSEGLDGGPNWKLTKFQGPGGGTGPGGQLVNFNRNAMDTLLITFVPACSSSVPPDTNWLGSVNPCPNVSPAEISAKEAELSLRTQQFADLRQYRDDYAIGMNTNKYKHETSARDAARDRSLITDLDTRIVAGNTAVDRDRAALEKRKSDAQTNAANKAAASAYGATQNLIYRLNLTLGAGL